MKIGAPSRTLIAASALTAVLAAGCKAAPPLTPFGSASGEPPEGGFGALAGVRDLDSESDFGSTDEQAFGGVELYWNRPGEPLALELGLSHSFDSDEPSLAPEVESEVTDVSLGLRYHFASAGVFRPYLGGGAALLHARTESGGPGFPDRDEEDWDGGLYAHAGAWAPLGDDLRLGVDLRWLGAEWLDSDELDLDHVDLALTLGTGF